MSANDTHSFKVADAKEYGVQAALLLAHFRFWIFNNRANGINFHEGKYWSYNSVEALMKTFPYWKRDQIRHTLDNLVTKGVLVKGNFSKTLNRATWYAFVDEDGFLGPNDDLGKTPNRRPTREKPQVDLGKIPNAFGENPECSIYTDTNQLQTADKAPPSSAATSVVVASPAPTNPAEQVFSYWQSVMQHPKGKLDAKRRATINARFTDGYTAADLMQAIDGCRNSEWHMGKNQDGKVYDALDLICRDGSKVDNFMALATRKPQAPRGPETMKERNARITAEYLGRHPGNDPMTIDMEVGNGSV